MDEERRGRKRKKKKEKRRNRACFHEKLNYISNFKDQKKS